MNLFIFYSSESVFRQTAEESFERIQIWGDTDRNPAGQTDRQIEMDGEKVEMIKTIMSSFRNSFI